MSIIQQIVDGRTDLVFEFVHRHGDAGATDSRGTSLIEWCAYHGDVSGIRFLLSHGVRLETLGVNFDLNGAAFHGHWQLCQFLIEQGADVNHSLPDTGETPLHSALCKANRPIYDHAVEILLAHGADPNATTNSNIETGSFMRDSRTKGETPLHRAAAFGTEKAIDLLLNSGANREALDTNGDSPLSWASWHLRPASVLKKLSYGVHSIHQDNKSTYDHGAGWGLMDPSGKGRPHTK